MFKSLLRFTNQIRWTIIEQFEKYAIYDYEPGDLLWNCLTLF
jgi:hypothetical protein